MGKKNIPIENSLSLVNRNVSFLLEQVVAMMSSASGRWCWEVAGCERRVFPSAPVPPVVTLPAWRLPFLQTLYETLTRPAHWVTSWSDSSRLLYEGCIKLIEEDVSTLGSGHWSQLCLWLLGRVCPVPPLEAQTWYSACSPTDPANGCSCKAPKVLLAPVGGKKDPK